MSLRTNVIRLAHSRPELRAHLLPVLREASTESVTAAARKAKPPAKAWWEHAGDERWKAIKAALDRRGVKDYKKLGEGGAFSIARSRGGKITYEVDGDIVVTVYSYQARDPRGGYGSSGSWSGSGSVSKHYFPLAEGADLPTWVEAMMTVVGNTSWA